MWINPSTIIDTSWTSSTRVSVRRNLLAGASRIGSGSTLVAHADPHRPGGTDDVSVHGDGLGLLDRLRQRDGADVRRDERHHRAEQAFVEEAYGGGAEPEREQAV